MTKPFQITDATAAGLSFGFPSRPDARIARTSDANATDQPPLGSGFRATYRGLIPSGSRPRTRRRDFSSQRPKANIPLSRAMALRAPHLPSARSMTAVSPLD